MFDEDTRALLETAMRELKQVSLVYDKEGATPGRRLVNPHVVFVSSRDKTCLHAVQVAGPSDGGRELPGWRPFDLSIAHSFQIEPTNFELDTGLNLANSDIYRRILFSVAA